MEPYKLWYWPGIQGRGEFVRLAMEAAGITYVDCAREQGVDALIKDMKTRQPFAPFAPPYLDVFNEDGIFSALSGTRRRLSPNQPSAVTPHLMRGPSRLQRSARGWMDAGSSPA